MTKGREKAIANLAESLRKYFPGDAKLSDEEIVKNYVEEEQLGHLANYYDTLIGAGAPLDSANGS
jgi:hypothetical protein